MRITLKQGDKLSVSVLCLLPMVSFLICISVIASVFTISFITDENEQAAILAGRIGKGISGEILIDDKIGLPIALERLKNKHNLEKLELRKNHYHCRWYQIGCSVKPILNIGMERYIFLLKGNKIYSDFIFTLCLLVLFSFLVTIVIYLILTKYISIPLEYLSKQLLKDVEIYLSSDSSAELQRCPAISPVSQISQLSGSIEDLAFSLKQSLIRQRKTELAAEKNAAIAKVVKTVAHDLRSPFSATESLMTSVRGAESIDELKEVILPSLEGEVVNAKRKAERLLGDLLDYNEEISLERQDFSIKNLVRESLQEISGMFEKSKIRIKCEFKHLNLLNCDGVRINQILTNIFTNAVQAMKGRGTIWIETASFDGFMEIVLGNDNSHIDGEDLTKVFDEDFTKGKKGGHGLGLAICKKMAELHGGCISVESCPEKPNVEFTLMLPEANRPDTLDSTIPESFRDFRAHKRAGVDHEQVKRNERTARLARLVDKKGRKFLVGLLDDERIYYEHVSKLIDGYPYGEIIGLRYFPSSDDLISFLKTKRLDFLISDIDLGEEINGYDVIEIMRNELSILDMPICVHSNRSGRVGMKFSWQTGGDFLVPKPMTIDHLLIFLAGDYKEVSEKLVIEKEVSKNITHRGIDKPTVTYPQ